MAPSPVKIAPPRQPEAPRRPDPFAKPHSQSGGGELPEFRDPMGAIHPALAQPPTAGLPELPRPSTRMKLINEVYRNSTQYRVPRKSTIQISIVVGTACNDIQFKALRKCQTMEPAKTFIFPSVGLIWLR